MPAPAEHTSLTAWRTMWKRLGLAAPDEFLFDDLVAGYREPHRHYHTLQHLDECFAKLQMVTADAQHPEEIELALWFHDAIYDVERADNEARSADWARAAVASAELPAAIADRVHALVMATRHNAVPTDVDQQLLVDVDLSILGASDDRFDEYERQIRAEYSAIPLAQFRAARRRVLAEFLGRPAIFNTNAFVAIYEVQARHNLARSIEKLSSVDSGMSK
jgi:predicted metal-dependent HD superfamily phosphohydrolase